MSNANFKRRKLDRTSAALSFQSSKVWAKSRFKFRAESAHPHSEIRKRLQKKEMRPKPIGAASFLQAN